jgi:hypothetical protein
VCGLADKINIVELDGIISCKGVLTAEKKLYI